MNLATKRCVLLFAWQNRQFSPRVPYLTTAVFALILLQRHLTPPQLAPLSYGKEEKDGGGERVCFYN